MQKMCVYICCEMLANPDPDNLGNENSLPDNEDIALAW